MVTQTAHEGDQLLFFQLLPNDPQHPVAILQVYRTGSGVEMSGNGVDNRVFILLGIDVCFEDADHVPELNSFTQNSHPSPF